jgi:cell division septal protein FtsQ
MAKKRKPISRSQTKSVRVSSRNRSNAAAEVGKYAVPALLLAVLLTALAFLAVAGYRSATASSFFALEKVDVAGNERTSREDVAKLVTALSEKTGVWHSDIAEMKARIEKFPFVKSASVTRNLPSAIRVTVLERVPAAVVSLSYGDYLVDTEGALLIPVENEEKNFPFVLHGWDEAKTEKAVRDNLARLRVYRKMLDESKQFDISTRVREFNLSNLREPVAVVEDSGRAINIALARDELGKSLKTAIEAVNGKGGKVKSVDSGGVHPIIQYLDF